MQTKTFGHFRLIPIPCSAQEENEHLRAFIISFINEPSRVHYQQALIERRVALNSALEELEQRLDTQYCRLIKDADGFLQRPARSTLGIYLDGQEGPYKITALDAGTISNWQGCDAIFSVDVGRMAMFFSRKGYALGCKR